jgi:hypothetical protein
MQTNSAASPYLPSSDQFTPAQCGIGFNRLGYGAMQLAGPHVWGPPKDRAAAVAVLRAAVEMGVNHIDTADFYGPHVTTASPSSPRSASGAGMTNRGCRPPRQNSCAPQSTTTCATWAWTRWT